MVRPRRKRKPVDRYSPPPLPKRKKRPKPRYTLVQRARYHRRTRNNNYGVLYPPKNIQPKTHSLKVKDEYGVLYAPKNIHFWNKIQPKTPYQTELEAKVFGIDGIWRIIKSYIFFKPLSSERVILCSNPWSLTPPCTEPGRNMSFDIHYFYVHRRGKLRKTRFKFRVYKCTKCYWKNRRRRGGRMCTIC